MVLSDGETQSWFLTPSVDQTIPRRAIGDEVRFADDACGGHGEGLEDPLPQQVAIECAGHTVNQGAEQDVAGVAVAPPGAGSESKRERRRQPDESVFGVLAVQVDGAIGVVGDSGRVGEQMADGHSRHRLFPSGRYLRTGSSRRRRPCSTSMSTSVAVNCFPMGAGLVDRAVAGGNPELEVGVAVPAGEQYAVTAEHGHRHSRDPLPRHFRSDEAVDRIHGERRAGLGRGDAARTHPAEREYRPGMDRQYGNARMKRSRALGLEPSAEKKYPPRLQAITRSARK